MTAAPKTYRVTVRVVPHDAASFNAHATVTATNAHDARADAEFIVNNDHRNARAVVAIAQRRIAA